MYLEITISILTLLATAIGTYIAYKGYNYRKRGKPKVRHNKSNRPSTTKFSVAFTIKVTKI